MKNKAVTIVVSASVGGAVGAGITYLVLRKKYEERINAEIKAFKEEYQTVDTLSKDNSIDYPSLPPEEKVKDLGTAHNISEDLGYSQEDVGPMLNPGPRSTVILNDEDGTADDIRDAPPEVRQELLEEALDPTNQKPYVISVEEFQHDMEFYSKNTITYYDKCGTLVDESDRPIDDVDYCIGDESLDRFGVSSQDPDIVYIRNDRISTDFEVIRHPGSFVNVVYGVQDDAIDPAERKNKRPKFRDDD